MLGRVPSAYRARQEILGEISKSDAIALEGETKPTPFLSRDVVDGFLLHEMQTIHIVGCETVMREPSSKEVIVHHVLEGFEIEAPLYRIVIRPKFASLGLREVSEGKAEGNQKELPSL